MLGGRKWHEIGEMIMLTYTIERRIILLRIVVRFAVYKKRKELGGWLDGVKLLLKIGLWIDDRGVLETLFLYIYKRVERRDEVG